MGKKILFAVMALLVMATGKIWAEEAGEGGTTTNGSTAYVVYDKNNQTLYFLCDEADLTAGSKITISGGTEVNFTEENFWSGDAVLKTGTKPGWLILIENNNPITKVVIKFRRY